MLRSVRTAFLFSALVALSATTFRIASAVELEWPGLLGGWDRDEGNFGDVWYSRDGVDWTELKSTQIWSKRHEHSAYVFEDRIWVAGGYGEVLDSQVWSLYLPPDFFS